MATLISFCEPFMWRWVFGNGLFQRIFWAEESLIIPFIVWIFIQYSWHICLKLMPSFANLVMICSLSWCESLILLPLHQCEMLVLHKAWIHFLFWLLLYSTLIIFAFYIKAFKGSGQHICRHIMPFLSKQLSLQCDNHISCREASQFWLLINYIASTVITTHWFSRPCCWFFSLCINFS